MKRSEILLPKLDLHDSLPAELRIKVKRVTRLLERKYGIPRIERSGDPLDTLIETILSQNTNDRNRDRAYESLKEQFPRWESVLRSDVREVVRAIRCGGLAEQKARRIRAILRWIRKRFGALSLVALKKMAPAAIGEMFGDLKGIGPKTIHCLLLFGLGREAFPVDTHVLRLGKRIGFIPEKMHAEKAHSWMALIVPKGKSLSLHLNLIRLGRSLCKANRPHCPECFLGKECLYSAKGVRRCVDSSI